MPRFTEQERDAIRNKCASEPLFKVSEAACNFFDNQLHDYAIWPEEIFFESAHIIDEFKENGEDLIPKIPQQWKILYSRLRSYDNTVPKEQLSLVTSIVLNIVAVVLRLSKDEVHQYMGKTLLNSVSENNRDWERVIVDLGNACNHFSHTLYTWINDYVQLSNEQYLSDDINDLFTAPQKPVNTGKRESTPFEPDFMTFTKERTSDYNIIALYQELLKVKWIEDGNPDDFAALFEGKNTECRITWSGKVGKDNLYALFKMMVDNHFIRLPEGHSLQRIVESHFVDKDGNYIIGIDSGKPSKSALTTIEQMKKILAARQTFDD